MTQQLFNTKILIKIAPHDQQTRKENTRTITTGFE